MNDDFDSASAGWRTSVFCASVGFLTALILNICIGTINLALKFPEAIILGTIGLYACAYFYGKIAGKLVGRVGANGFLVWIIGVLLAWSCVVTMTVAGTSASFFAELSSSGFGEAFFDYVYKPVLWISAFGFVPSVILGLIWAKLMKNKFSISN